MIDPNFVKSISDSKLGITIAKQLWPSMLFLVVCLIIGLIGELLFISKVQNQANTIVAMWVWIFGNMYVTWAGIMAFNKDVKIQIEERLAGLSKNKGKKAQK